MLPSSPPPGLLSHPPPALLPLWVLSSELSTFQPGNRGCREQAVEVGLRSEVLGQVAARWMVSRGFSESQTPCGGAQEVLCANSLPISDKEPSVPRAQSICSCCLQQGQRQVGSPTPELSPEEVLSSARFPSAPMSPKISAPQPSHATSSPCLSQETPLPPCGPGGLSLPSTLGSQISLPRLSHLLALLFPTPPNSFRSTSFRFTAVP